MTQASGTTRPGGRTARTRDAVHAAVRELLDESESGVITLPEVAARSGVHQATIYRRWRTVEALLLDVAMTEASRWSPVPVTGDLKADLLDYGRRLVEAVHRPGGLGVARALIAAAADPAVGLAGVREFGQPRTDRFQLLLDRAGATELTPLDIVELIHFPVYVAAMMSNGRRPPESPEAPGHIERLVDNVLAVLAQRRRRPTLVIVCGLPGSGKTTTATEIAGWRQGVRLGPDDWMTALDVNLWDSAVRERVEALQWSVAQDVLRAGGTVVIEWGTWARSERDTLRTRARELGASVRLVYLDVPDDELWRRIQARRREDPPIQRSDIDTWRGQFEAPDEQELSLYD